MITAHVRRVVVAIGALALAAGMVGGSTSVSAADEGAAADMLEVGGGSVNSYADFDDSIVVDDVSLSVNPNYGAMRFTVSYSDNRPTSEYRLRVGQERDGQCRTRYVVRGFSDGTATPVVEPVGDFTRLERDRAPQGTRRQREILYSEVAKGVAADCIGGQVVKRGSPKKPKHVYTRFYSANLDVNPPDPTLRLTEKWGDPHRLATGKWETLNLGVDVQGDYEAATDVRVALDPGPGVEVRPERVTLGDLLPFRNSRKVQVEVRMTEGGESSVGAVLSAASVQGAERKRIEVYSPREHVSNGSLRGRQYWTWGKKETSYTDNEAIWFVNDRWAYRGIPEGGVPRCKDWTAESTGDGCVRSWYDEDSGSVQVDNALGEVTGGRLTLEGATYRHRRGIPKQGRRFDVRLEHFDLDCWVKACDRNTYVINLYPDGRFRRFVSRYDGYENTTTKMTARGKYAVRRDGRIVFNPRHRKAHAETISIARTASGKLVPKRGITLDDVNYYRGGKKS